MSRCNTSDLKSDENYDPERDLASTLQDVCEPLVKYDYDWAKFIQGMLQAASVDYGDPTFVDRLATPENRISAMQNSDLLIQAALMPNSRIRSTTSVSADSTAVYVGYNDLSLNNGEGATVTTSTAKIFTVALSAAYVVDNSGSQFRYGSEDRASELQTFLGTTSAEHSWNDFDEFFLYPGTSGTIEINNSLVEATRQRGLLRTPFGGGNATTVLQVAAISSAAAGNG